MRSGTSGTEASGIGTPVSGRPGHPASLRRLDAERAVLMTEGAPDRRALVLPEAESLAQGGGSWRFEVVFDGWRVEVDVESASRAVLRARATRGTAEPGASGPTEVRAMIPGVVLAVDVTAGDTVAVGQKVVVVEAMKMQNELRAPREGTVERVLVVAGTRIEVGDLLLVIS